MSSAAPRSDLEYCRTQKGATWQSIVHCFCLYFETRDDSELSLTGSSITFTALLGALAQLVTQVLTGHLTQGAAYDCVQAMVCFNTEGSTLGAEAICYLTYDPSGAADGVVFKVTGCDPTKNTQARRNLQRHSRLLVSWAVKEGAAMSWAFK